MPAAALGLTRAEDIEWVMRRQVNHPYRTLVQPLRLTNVASFARLPKTFVNCHSATGSFDQFARRVRSEPSWQYMELNTGHDAMVIDPQGTANVLLRCAA